MQRLDPGAERVERITAELGLEPRAQVGLEDVARRDVVEDGAQRVLVLLGRRRHLEGADRRTTSPPQADR